MKTIIKKEKSKLKQRINEPRKFIQVILGPRQVGKTTMIGQLIGELTIPFISVSADGIIASDSAWIEQQWENLRLKLKSQNAAEGLLIIDEIQKIENWSEAVKKEWDADTRNHVPIKLILLGSARLLLQQGLTESLAGRFEVIPMTHWTFSEMHEAFGWSPEEFVWFGGYPGSAELAGDEPRWKDYIRHSMVETSLSKDILMLTRIDKPALLRRLYDVGVSYSGQILSYNKILGQLKDAGNTTTLAHYLTLLDSAGLLSGLEKFSRGAIRQRASSPKWIVQNTALLSSGVDYTFTEARGNAALWGRHVESAIGAYLINECKKKEIKVCYWREKNDEVDFVLHKGSTVIGIEVKSGSKSRVSGMTAFKKLVVPDKIYLVGNDGIPWQEFLLIDIERLF